MAGHGLRSLSRKVLPLLRAPITLSFLIICVSLSPSLATLCQNIPLSPDQSHPEGLINAVDLLNDIDVEAGDDNTESLLLTIIDTTERVTNSHLCDHDDLGDVSQQIACAQKQMEWAKFNQVSEHGTLPPSEAQKILNTYFRWCYASCGKISCKSTETRTRCLKICCPFRDQMISVGHTNPFWNCKTNRYAPDPRDYNPCLEMK